MNVGLLKLLKDKKVADAYQFYETCDYKLYLAELSFEALGNVIQQYQDNEGTFVKKVFNDARILGKGVYKAHDNYINYLGKEVSPTIVMDKLTIEIMSLLHNFFDTFAQWINAGLFAEAAIPMETVSLTKIARNLPEFPEYSGQFITDVISLPSHDDYVYISDFNNTLKHRHQIHVVNKFNILEVDGNVCIPKFVKDGRPHIKVDALKMLRSKIDFCMSLLSESISYIKLFYAYNDNQYTTHRIYNPETFLFFKNKEDYEHMRSPKNHYYYIEVDTKTISDEYHIMLVWDDMSQNEDGGIECFNSVYPIIMLREVGTQYIVGILKPEDNETYAMDDEHELVYRKYISQTAGYEDLMFQAICGDETFRYFPMLSKMTGGYGQEEY